MAIGDDHGHNRRREDQEFAAFMGEMREWKETSEKWRPEVDRQLKEVTQFMDELRTPRKLVVWTIRAFTIAAIGGFVKGISIWIKSHVHFN